MHWVISKTPIAEFVSGIVDASMIGSMAILPAILRKDRKRGNPNWERPMPAGAVAATEFELQSQ